MGCRCLSSLQRSLSGACSSGVYECVGRGVSTPTEHQPSGTQYCEAEQVSGAHMDRVEGAAGELVSQRLLGQRLLRTWTSLNGLESGAATPVTD